MKQLHSRFEIGRLGFDHVAERRDVDAHGGSSGDASGSECEAPHARVPRQLYAPSSPPNLRAHLQKAPSSHRPVATPRFGARAPPSLDAVLPHPLTSKHSTAFPRGGYATLPRERSLLNPQTEALAWAQRSAAVKEGRAVAGVAGLTLLLMPLPGHGQSVTSRAGQG